MREKYKYSLILLREFVRTDFKVKYQDSVIGYLWSILKPLFMFSILYVVFVQVLRVGAGIENWPVALLTGVVLWQFFSDVTGGALKSIVSSGALLRKIKFPRYIIIVSNTVSAFITLIINSVVIAIFAIFTGVEFSWWILMAIPLVLELFIFAIGVAFFLSAAYVKFRDIQYIWDVFSQALFYGSAILFPVSLIAQVGGVAVGDALVKIALANPVAQVIQDFRHLVINDSVPSLYTMTEGFIWYLVPLSITVAVFIFGAWFFKRRAPYFAEDV